MGRSHVSMCAELPIQQTIHSETFRTNCRKAILVTRRQSGPSYARERLIARPTLGEDLRHADHQQAFRHRFNHPLRLGLFPKTFLKAAQMNRRGRIRPGQTDCGKLVHKVLNSANLFEVSHSVPASKAMMP